MPDSWRLYSLCRCSWPRGRARGVTYSKATICALLGGKCLGPGPRIFRLFVVCLSIVGAVAVFLAAMDSERLSRITTFADPFKDYHDTGWPAFCPLHVYCGAEEAAGKMVMAGRW